MSEKEVSLKLSISPQFSYLDYHADCLLKIHDRQSVTEFSLIKQIMVSNTGFEPIMDGRIEISFSSPLFSAHPIHIGYVDSGSEIEVVPPFFEVDKKQLDEISESIPSSVSLVLYDGDICVAAAEEPFEVLPVSQPSENAVIDNRLFAKYVTPQSKLVKQVTNDAVALLKRRILAYQNEDKNEMAHEIESIFFALKKANITYQNPPAGTQNFFQRVRMPEEVLLDKKGTCFDLSVLFCACLEEVGYHPIMVRVDGHAYCGVFLEEGESFPNGISNERNELANKANDTILFVNATGVENTIENTFQGCVDRATEEYLKTYEGETFVAIDINACHHLAFSPIPTFEGVEELELNMEPKYGEGELSPILKTKYINVLREGQKDRFTFWEKKLLDLNESNPLINLNVKEGNCVALYSEKAMGDFFASEIDSLGLGMVEALPNTDFRSIACLPQKPSDIFGVGLDEEIPHMFGYEKTLKKLIKKSNDAMNETGTGTLHLCLGLLSYTRKNGKQGHAPFMVLPIKKIVKEKMSKKYRIEFDIEEMMVNETFFEYYANEHSGYNFEGLYEATYKDGYDNIALTFSDNCKADIHLEKDVFLISNFSFSHFVMWKDMKKNSDLMAKNPFVSSILHSRNELPKPDKQLDETRLEDAEKYENFAAPLSYDSTQLKAILRAGAGESFILDGPPGTGKSQTIVNMIVNAFYQGKTVLFVAEKKAALDVVADRLNKIELGRFFLELHSTKANKNDFYKKLDESMVQGRTLAPAKYREKCLLIDQQKKDIAETIETFRSSNKYYLSLYDCIETKIAFGTEGHAWTPLTFSESFLSHLDVELDCQIREKLSLVIELSNRISDYDHSPFKGMGLSEFGYKDHERYFALTSANREAYAKVVGLYVEIGSAISA
ncbi:MAG: DUF4011 domain-containing protein, partial [Bacilli bacterium]|nr:DUF4011 domain-containing protein [Bacilli bacterium]